VKSSTNSICREAERADHRGGAAVPADFLGLGSEGVATADDLAACDAGQLPAGAVDGEGMRVGAEMRELTGRADGTIFPFTWARNWAWPLSILRTTLEPSASRRSVATVFLPVARAPVTAYGTSAGSSSH